MFSRDCMTLNIMMDPKPMFPELYHPVLPMMRRDFKGYVRPYSRTARPVKYYWTDFGLSVRFDPQDANPVAMPVLGGDKTVPEYIKNPRTPCNPFRVDVYNVGNLIREDFLQASALTGGIVLARLMDCCRCTGTSLSWTRSSRACAMMSLRSGPQ